ncbi:MAG TPA: MFS transporter [Candidatus Paceibacterota bacterium]|nr:MFS transporter [Candidatus Paceibacterota bacterium]
MLNKKLRLYTYIGAIFMATYSSLPAYINSSFLATFLSEENIGWLYATTSIVTIIMMISLPRLISSWGNKKILLILSCLSFLSLIPLALTAFSYQPTIIIALVTFGTYLVLGYLTRYVMDVYLENISDNQGVGLIRGLYMTFYNFAWLISPFLAAYLVREGNYGLVYGVASLMFLPLLLIITFGLREVSCHTCVLARRSVWLSLKNIWARQIPEANNIRRILIIDFLLNFFYAIMVVYMPLYLHNHIGLPWSEIGLAFTIMLTPFILLELPLGEIADRWLGEKEILITGLIIIIISTASCAYLGSPLWFFWAGLLFVTRVGAASIEIMKETYLFKKISGGDTGIMAISRINVPFSYLTGTIFGSLILIFYDFRYIFLGLSLVLIIGLKQAWHLVDTK